MRRLILTRLQQAAPMGQQACETNLERELRALADGRWEMTTVEVTNWRDRASGATRVPFGPLWQAPLPAARALGRLVYPPHELCHRLDLRCPAGRREVITVQDLPGRHFDDEGVVPRSGIASLRRARAVIAVSRFTAAELAELGVENVRVIPNGLDPLYAKAAPASPEGLQRLGVDGPFLLHAAGATRRKNLDGLAEAWRTVSRAHPELSLLLAGPPHPRRDALFSDLPRARILGRLEPAEVASLMRAAAAVVVPSLYEGFGLPALEGMAVGTPVVAADRGALPEVCGEAALLVEPDGGSLAAGLLRVLEDEALAARLRAAGPVQAAGFSWRRAAEATLAVYEAAAG